MIDGLLDRYKQQWRSYVETLSEDSWLLELREGQLKKFLTAGIPTVKDEFWKYTDLQSLKKHNFTLSSESKGIVSQAELESFYIDSEYRLVFIDGIVSEAFSHLPTQEARLIVSSLSNALKTHTEEVREYLQFDHPGSHSFALLNTACLQDGAFIVLPEDCCLSKPLHLLYLSTTNAKNGMQHAKNIFVLHKNAKARLVEDHYSLADEVYFQNIVTQIHAGENADVQYIKLQNQAARSFHIASTSIYQQKMSQVDSHLYHLGSELAREDVHSFLMGDGSSTQLQGLYLPLNKQHIDIHTDVHHQADNTSSEERYNGIIANKSCAVFNGKIIVDKNTSKTSANLQNKNIILTSDSTVNSKPELEIFAQDVKCKHGATVGQIDQDMLFYLRSRGISKEQAYQYLLMAFVNEYLTSLSPSLVDKITQTVMKHCEEKFYE